MNYKDAKERVLAVSDLLSGDTISREKFESVRKILKGLHPKIDTILSSCSRLLSKVEKLEKGEVIELSAEMLPAKSEQEKKRKKALLLFLHSWKELKSEVRRVERELEREQGSQRSPQATISSWGRIFGAAKGPLGLITVLALGIVYLRSVAVSVTIKNSGCDTISPVVSLPIAVPGLELPREPIPPGGAALAKLPPLRFSVDTTEKNTVVLTALSFTMKFHLTTPGITIWWDGASLMDKRSEISLGEKPQHELLIACR